MLLLLLLLLLRGREVLLTRWAAAATAAVPALKAHFTGACAAMLRIAPSRRRSFGGRRQGWRLDIVINSVVTQLLWLLLLILLLQLIW